VLALEIAEGAAPAGATTFEGDLDGVPVTLSVRKA